MPGQIGGESKCLCYHAKALHPLQPESSALPPSLLPSFLPSILSLHLPSHTPLVTQQVSVHVHLTRLMHSVFIDFYKTTVNGELDPIRSSYLSTDVGPAQCHLMRHDT